ncbi:hypothetical protein C1H76_2077 [Elsinoe australis]|uniref:Nucleoporin NDC1 n=1 Tax=Elsinoe australis TaxID=40998 RepID=A0A4U7B3K8_9PEZI|nr:hypothetical protein C1H76_2077 [Elsinoe australis]
MPPPNVAGIASSAKPGLPRARPYKDFLTPALHRCFTNAAIIGLLVCWIEAILMSKPHLFWSWFPFSMTGLRLGLLFVSCLTIFVLRVAFMHIGSATDRSTFDSFWRLFVSKRAIWTAIWYCTSGFLFSEVYIFSTAQSANLAWIDPGRSYERMRLNERAVMLRTMFVLLSLGQAMLHLAGDYDALEIPYGPAARRGAQQPTSSQALALAQMKRAALPTLLRAVILTFVTAIWGTILYFLALRRTAWSVAYSIGKLFYTLQKSNTPSGLSDVFHLFFRFMFSGTLLVIMWQLTNLAFSIYASQEPLKKGTPLTNDSKDPNASLVNGIKLKRELPHSIALWELLLIAERFEERRRTIYSDFEKPGSTTWAEISGACLAEVERVSQSIRDAQTASTPKPAPVEAAPPPKARISQPLRDDPAIFNAAPKPSSTFESVAVGVGAAAKSLGQSPAASPLANKARAIMGPDSGKSTVSDISQKSRSYALDFLRTPFGAPFRVPFDRRINAIVLGHPHSRAANIHNAVQAVCQLSVCSLKEDNFGQVQKDIGRIMRVLMAAIRDVQGLVQSYPPHWTDVDFDGERRVRDVEELVGTMKQGLEMVVNTFGEYAEALEIGRAELRSARDLVGRGEERVAVR